MSDLVLSKGRQQRADIQLAVHREVCEDSLLECVERRGKCFKAAESVAWALGLDGGGSDAE